MPHRSPNAAQIINAFGIADLRNCSQVAEHVTTVSKLRKRSPKANPPGGRPDQSFTPPQPAPVTSNNGIPVGRTDPGKTTWVSRFGRDQVIDEDPFSGLFDMIGVPGSP